MKICSILSSLVTLSWLVNYAQALDITITCLIGTDDCHEVKQEKSGSASCANGKTNKKQASITVKYCGTDDNGIANRNIQIRGAAATTISGSAIEVSPNPSLELDAYGCKAEEIKITVDTCQSHFNVLASVQDDYEFQTFMKRNCDLEAAVTCTVLDSNSVRVDCTEMTACDDTTDETEVTYTYCYSTNYKDHTIKIRQNYLPNASRLPDNCENGCKESHAYIGDNFDAANFFNGFPDQTSQFLGMGYANNFCFEKKHKVDTCDKGYIPQAYMNVVGSVVGFRTGSTPLSEFKACYDNAKFEKYFIGANGKKGGLGGGNKNKKSKAPSNKTKSPSSSKGTKSPSSSKGTKSPSSSKGTKSPSSSKGTKSPSSSKGTKSPSMKEPVLRRRKRILRN